MNAPAANIGFLDNREWFTPCTDPKSGITSFVLRLRVAPLQQSFYYTNPSFSRDGRFYWFYCSFPPSGNAACGRSLAVMDFQSGQLRHFPETQFAEASPMVDPKNGDVYWSNESGIWKRSPFDP